MRITGKSGAGYHPYTGVEACHTSSMHRMGRDKTRTTLFGPKAFQVGASGNALVVNIILCKNCGKTVKHDTELTVNLRKKN